MRYVIEPITRSRLPLNPKAWKQSGPSQVTPRAAKVPAGCCQPGAGHPSPHARGLPWGPLAHLPPTSLGTGSEWLHSSLAAWAEDGLRGQGSLWRRWGPGRGFPKDRSSEDRGIPFSPPSTKYKVPASEIAGAAACPCESGSLPCSAPWPHVPSCPQVPKPRPRCQGPVLQRCPSHTGVLSSIRPTGLATAFLGGHLEEDPDTFCHGWEEKPSLVTAGFASPKEAQ